MTDESLRAENTDLRRRLEEAEETLRAIQSGTVDAVVVEESVGHRVYTLEGADRPYRLFIEAMNQGAATLHVDGTIVWVNRRLALLLGFSYEQLIGRSLREVVAKDDHSDYDTLFSYDQFNHGGTDVHLLRSDGTFIAVQLTLTSLPEACGVAIGVLITDLTAERHHERLAEAHQALQQSEEDLRIAVAAAKLGQWSVDLTTWEMTCSDTCKANFGRAANEPFSYAELWNSVHPDDLPRVRADLERAIYERTDYDSEYRNVWPDGSEHWVLVRGRAQYASAGEPLSIQGVSVDITERMLANTRERRLLADAAEANAKFKAIFDQGALFAGIMDIHGTVLEPNRLSWEGCGYSPDQIIGRPFWDCPWWNQVPELVAKIRGAIQQATLGNEFHEELPYFIANGYQRTIDLIVLPIKDEVGRVLFLAVTGIDTTERKAMEDELRSLAAHLSDADHRKDEFLATLAHELRNPLAPISNALAIMELARDDGDVFEQTKDTMRRQLSHMVRLIDDLLDISRITRGKIELRRQRVSLAAVLGQAIETSRPSVEAANHRLIYTAPLQPIIIDGDAVRLSQVFSNLLNNSCKYSEANGIIEVMVSFDNREHLTMTSPAEISADNQAFVTILVRDRGIGIPAEMLPKVFEMFTQVDHSLERSQGGLGIGLSLVKSLVELHGGTVAVASKGLGQGSEFRVRLPVVPKVAAIETTVSPESRLITKQSTNDSAQQGNAPKRILVVDDNADSATSLAMLLKMQGNHTRVAHDGEAAVHEATTFRPHLVLLDIGLPKLNGYEAARRIRNQDGGQQMVLIAITGWGQEEDRNKSREAGFNHHLVKPVDLQALQDLITELHN